MRLHIAALALLLASSVQAQIVRPGAEPSDERTQFVRLLGKSPLPCTAIAFTAVRVVLPSKKLLQLVSSAPKNWTTETERLALIRGKRAAEIVQAVSLQSSREECQVVAADALHDALYLVKEFLEDGQAVLLDDNGSVPSVAIRYVGLRGGPHPGEGITLVSVPGSSQPFLTLRW